MFNRTFGNSEDPDEILHKVVFPPGLHCLLRLKQSSGEEGVWCQSDYEDDPSVLVYGIKVSLVTCICPDK